MLRTPRPSLVRFRMKSRRPTATTAHSRPRSCGSDTTIEPMWKAAPAKGTGTRCWSEPQPMSTRFSKRMRNAMEVTSGTKCSLVRIRRYVKRSTTSDSTPPLPMAISAASGHGTECLRRNHVSIPATMNRPGMLKLRKFRMPIVRVKATATSAYTLPSINPLTICCSSTASLAMRDVREREGGAFGQLVQEALGVAERRTGHVPEEEVVDLADLGDERLDALSAGGGQAKEGAA